MLGKVESDFAAAEDGPDNGTTPDMLPLAKTVARLRAEIADLEDLVSMTAVVERAKGIIMQQAHLTADAAYELLLARADHRHRTLVEECWIILGQTSRDFAAEPRRDLRAGGDAPPAGDVSPFGAEQYLTTSRAGADRPTFLADLAESLTGARTPHEVAGLLWTTLHASESVDAVMIYVRSSAGNLELTGHAGIDDALAEQWSSIPPLAGVAPVDALTEGRPLWLEEPEQDAARYRLVEDPARPWSSRAWIPLPGEQPAATAVGVLRRLAAPFDTATRSRLLRAVRLCAGALGGGSRREAADLDRESADAVQGVFDVLPGPAVLLQPVYAETGVVEDYRIEAAATESVDVAGRRGRELVGHSILEMYPTVAGTALWDGYLATLTTGTVYESGPFDYEEVASGVPRRSSYSVRASRLGSRLAVSWIRHDGSEQETRRLADLQRLGNLGWVKWDLTTNTVVWSEQVYIIFGRDPDRGPMTLEELPEHVVPGDVPSLGTAVRRLLDGGAAIDLPCRITGAYGVRHVRIVAETRTDADGVPVEVHGFVQDLTALRDAENALVKSERALLVQRGVLQAERVLAARLREALLPVPEQRTELAGLCVHVSYVPADTGVNVGGDWYSALELADGGALFVVGDVAGHGLAAVGAMAQLRFTGKGMAITGSALPEVLKRLNTLLLRTAEGSYATTATMVIARYHPRLRRLTWASAGHPPPLLIRDGRAVFLPQPVGLLLGAARDFRYDQATIDLLPGDRLLFYTDGLVEERGEDIDEGMERLAETALGLLRADPGAPLASALAGLRPHPRDDICVLDIHVPHPAG
ncbi:SpoIIE family protein phosphatase [Streptomyces adustus]